MPFHIPSEARISHLIRTFDKGGQDEAMIIDQNRTTGYYSTELEEIGPCYVMDDFGNGQQVSFDDFAQAIVYLQ